MDNVLTRDIAPVKAGAIDKVNRDAERVRGLFVTPGTIQSMVDEQKMREAQAFLANPAIDAAEIPHIVAEAQAFGLTNEQQAQSLV